MKTNIEFYEYGKANPEELLDPFYTKNAVVIPTVKEDSNQLTENNEKLLNLITTFSVLVKEYQKDIQDETISKIVDSVVEILNTTENINYSAFVQFFMVHNSTFSIYEKLKAEDKKKLVYEMLKKYCQERHSMYLSHGYTNIVLQVMSDHYSHKRNSKMGIEKVLGIIEPYGMQRLRNEEYLLTKDDYYFLPDKGDAVLFEDLLKLLDIEMKSRETEQSKLPDMVFKHNGHYYICELKTMKEGGGGQDKQIVEITNFIRYSEKNAKIHYLAFIDCNYSNIIFGSVLSKRKNKQNKQREDIIECLKNNPQNYLLNTAGMKEFIKEIFE